jgi:hypothetical protein
LCKESLSDKATSAENIVTNSFVRTSLQVWQILHLIFESKCHSEHKLSFFLKSYLNLIKSLQSKALPDVISTLESFHHHFATSWKWTFGDFSKLISQLVGTIKDDNIILFFVNICLEHHQLLSVDDAIYEIQLLLAQSLCVPCFIKKMSGKTGQSYQSIAELLNSNEISNLFIPTFFEVLNSRLINIGKQMSLEFPFFLVQQSGVENLSVEIIRQCRLLKIYVPEQQSTAFEKINCITEETIQREYSSLLTEICKLDLRPISKSLFLLLNSPNLLTSEFSCSILQTLFDFRDPTALFSFGFFPFEFVQDQNFVLLFKKLCSQSTPTVLNYLLKIFISLSLISLLFVDF